MRHFFALAILLSSGLPDTLTPQVREYARQQERQLQDSAVKEMDRVGALYTIRRLDPGRAVELAAAYLKSPERHLRFAAASTRAKGGKRDGENALLAMLVDPVEGLGFRGLSARALASTKSSDGHDTIVRTAIRELKIRPYVSDAREASVDRRPFLGELLEALGEYGKSEDVPLAKELFAAADLASFTESIGLFGSPDLQSVVRDLLRREKNAGQIIQGQLALARCGGADGVSFVKELIRRGATLKNVEGAIDMEKEDPLSGRLVAHGLLIDLGRHSSDRQFAQDLVSMVDQGPCAPCLDAWDALARVGTAGYESQLVKIAVSKDRGIADKAMHVLAFNGATDAVRALAKQAEMVEAGERYLASHAEGSDRRSFVGRMRTFD